jgi:hypothetical protein
MRQIVGDADGRLLRAVIAGLGGRSDGASRQDPCIIVESCESTEWASLTFAGRRHRIVLIVPPMAAAAAQSRLADGFDLAGSIVAAIEIIAAAPVADAVTLTTAVLTINEQR